MRILHNKKDLQEFIQQEAWGQWSKRELESAIKPESYPCAVFTHWGESANGDYLVSHIVYPKDFEKE